LVGGPACRCAEVGPRARTPAQSSTKPLKQSARYISASAYINYPCFAGARSCALQNLAGSTGRKARGIADPLGWARDKHSDRLQNLSESDALLSFRCAGFSLHRVPPHVSDRLNFQPRYSSALRDAVRHPPSRCRAFGCGAGSPPGHCLRGGQRRSSDGTRWRGTDFAAL
jgi:hypothetical protein